MNTHEAHELIEMVRSTVRQPLPGVTPYKGEELLGILDRALQQTGDHRAFFAEFVDAARDLLDDEEEDRILRRFTRHALSAEQRIHADSRDTRDHLAHVTQDFLLGWILLNRCRQFSSPPEGWRPYGWPDDRDERWRRLNKAWLFTALLHDCAYSLEHARDGQRHELVVRGLLGDLYRQGRAGQSDPIAVERQADDLWRLRTSWIQAEAMTTPWRSSAALHKKLEGLHQREDHSIVGALALWREAEDVAKSGHEDLSEILRPAAVAAACHNFRWLVDIQASEGDEANHWLRLDLWEEPLGALLALCDELQEWGREREDESLLRLQAFEGPRFAATELSHLRITDGNGVSIEARLVRRLHPEDRAHRVKLCQQREAKLANTSQQLAELFRPRTAPEAFRVRLKCEETMDDVRCNNALELNWTCRPGGMLERLSGAVQPMATTGLQDVHVTLEPSDDRPGACVALEQGTPVLRLEGVQDQVGLRLCISAQGGAGKSTLLRALSSIDRLGRRPTRTFYVEQLGGGLVNLGSELRQLRQREPDRDLLLLVDHLDRLAQDEHSAYWIEQLRTLPREPWLHAIVASRPEELERELGALLDGTGWQSAKIRGPPALLVGGQADAEGKPLAAALERALRVDPREAFEDLAALAASMGHSRLHPGAAPNLNATWAGRPLIEPAVAGGVRFLHDVVQDFLAASHLALTLARFVDRPPDARAALRMLTGLPPDVFRLLLDTLADRSSGWLTAAERRDAASAWGRGLLVEPTVQQWLYDTGRLERARHALSRFGERYSDIAHVRLFVDKLSGHISYGKMSWKPLSSPEQRVALFEHGRDAVLSWASAGAEADRIVKDQDPSRARAGRWVLAFLADHLLSALNKLRLAGQDEARALAIEAAQRLEHVPHADVLRPGWLRSILLRFGDATTDSEFDEAFAGIEADLENEDQVPATQTGAVGPLTVRRAHLTGHLGNYMMRHAFTGAPDLSRLKTARRYFESSIFLRDRVMRRMRFSPGETGGGIELFATEAQGQADVANQHRGVFESYLLGARLPGVDSDIAARLLVAHREHEQAWALAEAWLAPAQRLPIMFRDTIAARAVGRSLEKQIIRPRSREEVDKELSGQIAGLQKDMRRAAVVHPRSESEGDADALSVYESIRGDLSTLLCDIARRGADDAWSERRM